MIVYIAIAVGIAYIIYNEIHKKVVVSSAAKAASAASSAVVSLAKKNTDVLPK